MMAFVINLDKDHERLAWVAAEAKRVGISLERFPAVSGCQLDGALRDQFFSVDAVPHEPALTAGEIGCYASHLRVLESLLADENNDYALVFEDDIHLADDFVSTIEATLSALPCWDIIRLSNATKSVVLPVATLPNGREIVRYWTVPNSAGAYLISRAGAKKFLQAYAKRTLPIDEDLRRPWRSGLDMYGILTPPVEPDVLGRSRITSMGRPTALAARRRFKHATPATDRIASWAYRMRVFGPRAFSNALVRVLISGVAKHTLGPIAAKRFWRLHPAPSFSSHKAEKAR